MTQRCLLPTHPTASTADHYFFGRAAIALLRRVPVHEPTALLRAAVARNTQVQIHFEGELKHRRRDVRIRGRAEKSNGELEKDSENSHLVVVAQFLRNLNVALTDD